MVNKYGMAGWDGLLALVPLGLGPWLLALLKLLRVLSFFQRLSSSLAYCSVEPQLWVSAS